MEHINEQVIAHLSKILSEGRVVESLGGTVETTNASPCYVKPNFRKRFANGEQNVEESVELDVSEQADIHIGIKKN